MSTMFAELMDIPEQSTTPIYASKNPSTNCARLCQLMMTVCVDLFSDVLDFCGEPEELYREIRDNFDYLKTMTGYQSRKLLKFFRFPSFQRELLPSKILDLSLLYIVLRTVCYIPQPTNGWGNSPETDDRSLAANIERIRIYGIKVLENSEEINDTDFQDFWQNLRTTINEIQKQVLNKDTYAEAVDELFSHTHISTRYIHRFQRLKGENFVLNAYLTYYHIITFVFKVALATWVGALAPHAECWCSNHIRDIPKS